MTALEERILEAAKEAMPDVLENIRENEENYSTSEEVKCMFSCDGVLDFLVYNTKKRKFTRIEYAYATKDLARFEGSLNTSATYCSEYETRIIEL